MKSGVVDMNFGKTTMDIEHTKNQRIGNMKKTHNKLTCLFGYHDYSEKSVKDKCGNYIRLCKICKRSGYWKSSGGEKEYWYTYDEKRNLIHIKRNDGAEFWYDEGNCIRDKYPDGCEYWLTNNGNWINSKPKNWKYDI